MANAQPGQVVERVLASQVGWFGAHNFCVSPDGGHVAWIDRVVTAGASDDDALLVDGHRWAKQPAITGLGYAEDDARLAYTARCKDGTWQACADRMATTIAGADVTILGICRRRLVCAVDSFAQARLVADELADGGSARRLWTVGPYQRLLSLEAPASGPVRAVLETGQGIVEVVDGSQREAWPSPDHEIARVVGPGEWITRERSWRGIRLERHGKPGPWCVAVICTATRDGRFAYAARERAGCRLFLEGEPGERFAWVDGVAFPAHGGPPAFIANRGGRLVDDRDPACPYVDGGTWLLVHGARQLVIPDVDQVAALQIVAHTHALVAVGYRGGTARLVGDFTSGAMDHVGRIRPSADGRQVHAEASRREELLCLTASLPDDYSPG